ncbi:organic hydroperoxide resistance protein [Streptomyces sp. NPDC002809]|uniref:organic hydroperoxide resistance protein n=1 Tax=Streptomyces sp. NPDC002809 TaxID=3154433 RepID=UPI003317F014
MTIHDTAVAYTAVATASSGRDGRVASDDGRLDVVAGPPKEMGGSGAGTNPEQLFAAGCSACFQGALGVVARQEEADITGSTVTASVSIGKTEAGGFGLEAAICAAIPNVDAVTAQTLIEKAHQLCPYSNATRGNVKVALSVA